MIDNAAFDPDELFEAFEGNVSEECNQKLELCKQALEKNPTLGPTLTNRTQEFIADSSEDAVRSWGAAVLELIDTEDAFDILLNVLEDKEGEEHRQRFPYTRYYALRVLEIHPCAQEHRRGSQRSCARPRKGDDCYSFFDGPRKSARDDLVALAKVSVIFEAFQHELSEIGASFKQAYLEENDFGPRSWKATVSQIEKATRSTLEEFQRYLPPSTTGNASPIPDPSGSKA